MLSIFSCSGWPYAFPLWKKCLFNSSSYSSHFLIGFFFMLSCMSCLYLLDINLLLVISFAHIFSHSVGFFSFCLCFLCCAKLLIRSHLFIFAFISFTLEDRSKTYCCTLCQRMFCLCFPLRVYGTQS